MRHGFESRTVNTLLLCLETPMVVTRFLLSGGLAVDLPTLSETPGEYARLFNSH
jgi:hypothetical protein